jgi:hypothetical protein
MKFKKDYELEVDINNAINYLYQFIIGFNNYITFSCDRLGEHIEY